MKLSDVSTYTKAEIKALTPTMLGKLVTRAKSLYEKGKSPISDAKFDMLEDALRKKDPDHDALTKVGATVKSSGRKKVKLPHPMYSLAKVKPESEAVLQRWIAKHPGPYVVSDKEDGLSLQIIYEKSRPTKVYTRGNGTIGQDVSHLIPYLRIPKKIGMPSAAIRAELVMSESAFKKYASPDDANARNLVAGLTNRINGDVSMLKRADVLAYEIIEPRFKPSMGFRLLKSNKFTTPPHGLIRDGELTVEKMSKLLVSARKSSDHAIDGIVIERDAVNKRPPAGTHSPSYAFAFKMQNEDDVKTVTIKSIDWEETKHGKLMPVIVIPPTQLAGVTVNNVTGHNAFFIANGFRAKEAKKGTFKKRPLGKGAVIRVVRSGDVIPHVVEVVKGVPKPDMPDVAFKWDAKRVNIIMDGTSDLVRDKRITAFFTTLEVEGVKLGVVQKLSAAGLTSIVKILRATVDDILEIPGYKERSAEKLIASIKSKTREVELPLLMDGSGYFGAGFGTKRATLVVDAYPDLLTKFANLTPSQITAKVTELEGFQTKTASQFGTNFHRFQKWLKVSKIKPVLPKKVKAIGSKLKGKSVCFTGFRDKALEEQIKKQGGTIASGVNKNTSILVYAAGKNSSKLSKAADLGLEVYTAEKFVKKYKL